MVVITAARQHSMATFLNTDSVAEAKKNYSRALSVDSLNVLIITTYYYTVITVYYHFYI